MAVPTGSLQESVLSMLRDAGYELNVEPRSYRPETNDPELWVKMLRPQEIPSLVADGVYDVGISGSDWVAETGASVERILDLGVGGFKIVLAVNESSPIQAPEDLRTMRNLRISTEYLNLTGSYLRRLGVKGASVHFSWGATEAKPPEEADAIIDGFQTGETLARNRLRIVDEVLESSALFIANRSSMKDEWKRRKIEGMEVMLSGALRARGKVLLKMNVPAEKLDEIAALVPAMERPTISKLYGEDWYALESVAEEKELIQLIPRLKEAGAKDIIEYDLKKVIP
jgi:ATP phosphoribosyltransferase